MGGKNIEDIVQVLKNKIMIENDDKNKNWMAKGRRMKD